MIRRAVVVAAIVSTVALPACRPALDQRGAPPDAAAWRQADLRRARETQERIALLPDSTRRLIAWADRATAFADSLERAGDGAEATRVVERQLEIRERWLGPLDQLSERSLSALARLAASQGHSGRAHDLNQTALERRRRTLGPRHPEVAESVAQLATGLKNAGAWQEALRLHREALAMRRELLGADAPEVAASLMGLGNVHRVMFQKDSALAAFGEALALRRRAPGPRSEEVASTLTDIAIVHTQAGEWSAAEPLLREALSIQNESSGRAREVELTGSMLGVTLRHLGRFAAAESLLLEWAASREASRARAAPGAGRATMFDLRGYWHLAAAQLELGHGEAAWISVERALSRTLIEALAERHGIDTVGMWRRPLARVQRALPEHAALIGWLEVQRGAGSEEWPFWCYAIRRHGPPRWHRVERPPTLRAPWPTSDLNAARNDLRAAAAWPLRVSDTTLAARLGRDIYRLRIAPLEPDLAGVTELIVVSPDVDHGLPLEALSDTAGRWMGERFAISYTPSAYWSALQSESRRHDPAPRRDRWRALLVGDPGYASGARSLPAATGGTPAISWPPIPESGAEVRDIAALFPDARVLLGVDASEAMLRGLADAGDLAGYQLVHLATHAAIDDRWPGRSALALAEAGGGPAGVGTDGYVTADDIATRWTLDAELVSLASCRSALGPTTHVEGYLGLNHAFLGAGARCLLVSLWRVEDQATALLMREFYWELTALPPGGRAPSLAFALQRAQQRLREWRDPSGQRPYAHPAYWAGVVLLGDAR